ncbi:MAG: hypothetical protein HKN62_08390, partial [Phycisphaerales bacterium]|nr:hypothetical protein [Phycisphaerales bacterium]
MNGWRVGAGFLLTVGGLGSAATADVNLEFRTETPIVAVGDVVGIQLYAVSDDGGKQGVSAIDAIFTWDPAVLDLLGVVEGPVGSAGFLEDPGGVNETIPPADGDGLLIYFAPLSTPLQATPEGTLVATLEFFAHSDAKLTTIDLIPEAGDPVMSTRVFDDKAAGTNILGTIAGTEVVVLPEPIGGCCLIDGSCLEGTVDECVAADGVYQGDLTACGGIACPQPPGSCCFDDGACDDVTEEDCDAAGGVFGGDFSECVTASCPQPGVCCLPDGVCEVVATLGGAECLAAAGTYQGDDTTCDAVSCPQPGACCFDDATCIEVRPADCVVRGGDFQGETVTCVAAACVEIEGACCLDTGGCIGATPSLCLAVAGDYQGGETTCATTGCPPATGACCLPAGGCVEVPASLCADLLGAFLGIDEACGTAECPPPGDARLEIDVRPESLCAGPGGVFVVELFMRDLGDFEAAGYQAFLVFDPAVMTFLSAAYASEPFSVPIIDPITATEAGTIKIAAGINPFDGEPTSDDTLLVTLLFIAGGVPCDGEILSFFETEPPSRITDLDGEAITATAVAFDCQDLYCPI